MVNELRELMRENVVDVPHDESDLAAVLRAGRRRVRVRRARIIGGTALASAAVVTTAFLAWPAPTAPDLVGAGVPTPEGPVLRLSEATAAVEGQDYRVLASYTNENLNEDNGQYFDGVTDDGLILFRDAPDRRDPLTRLALMDPATQEKDWLPEAPGQQDEQLLPLELSEERLLWTTAEYEDSAGELRGDLKLVSFDRETRSWSTQMWPELPQLEHPAAELGPDNRLYVMVPASQGKPPEGGWPMGPDGEADDADAEGDTYHLWSASLDDPADVRDEGLTVGAVEFTDSSMVWTDSSNGEAGVVHVQDLDTGADSSFDPHLGEKCNLLGFSAAGEHIAMSQYCGTYEGGVRDDRVQVMTTDGELVTTIQDSGVEGGRLHADGGFLTLVGYDRVAGGTYAYDVEDEELLRLTDAHAPWAAGGGPTPDDQFMWSTPAGGKVPGFGPSGATFWLGELP